MRKQIKDLSKSQLKGRWGSAILAFFVVSAISTAISYSMENILGTPGVAISIGGIFISSALGVGSAIFALNFIDGRDELSDIFSGFKIILKATGLALLVGICVLIGMVFLIVPGIIAGIMFSQCYFILAEDSSKGVMECLKESKNLMKGRLWEYFVLQLSFLGWIILSVFTCGIGLLWLVPYQNITFANYYRMLKEVEVADKSYY